jgi:hypothetical protein
MTTIRRFLLVQAVAFGAASLVHRGLGVQGFEHRQAAIAETVIGVVLVAALAVASIRPAWTRGVGLIAQGFALLGTLVGVVMIAIGVGPRTVPDVVFHTGLLALLITGLTATAAGPA